MLEEKTPSSDGNKAWEVTTAPIIEPVTIAELKLFARIDADEEDSMLITFIETDNEHL